MSELVSISGEGNGKRVWIYVNGIRTSKLNAVEHANQLKERLLEGEEVLLLYNPTRGAFADMLETAYGFFFQRIQKFCGPYSLFPPSDPAKALTENLSRLLKDPEREEVHVVAHSQGTVITGNSIFALKKARINMSKLWIHSFANCFPSNIGDDPSQLWTRMEDFENFFDPIKLRRPKIEEGKFVNLFSVASLGSHSFEEGYLRSMAKGRVFAFHSRDAVPSILKYIKPKYWNRKKRWAPLEQSRDLSNRKRSERL